MTWVLLRCKFIFASIFKAITLLVWRDQEEDYLAFITVFVKLFSHAENFVPVTIIMHNRILTKTTFRRKLTENLIKTFQFKFKLGYGITSENRPCSGFVCIDLRGNHPLMDHCMCCIWNNEHDRVYHLLSTTKELIFFSEIRVVWI